MIKYILVSLTALFLVSCSQVNSNGEKIITQGGDTIGEVDISLSKMDLVEELSKIDEPETSKLLFKASGTEPGWFAEFYNNKLRLVVDYGKDSLNVESQFDNLDSKDGFMYEIAIGDKTNKNFIQIINKSCTDAGSGDTKDRQVALSYKGKTYKGCGNFSK